MRSEAVASDDGGQASLRLSTFAELYDEMLPVVLGYCRARLAEPDAEDVTAEVFRSALQRLDVDPHVDLRRGWFLTAARNRIIDRWRHEARWRSRLAVLAVTESRRLESSTDDVPGGVVDMLDRLPSTQRAALILHHVDGHSVVEIADLLGSSPPAVESLLARARRRLRTELDGEGGASPGR